MTISSNVPRVSFICNGATVDFPFPYPVLLAADLTVIEVLDSTGAETAKVLTTDWTIPETPEADGSFPLGVTVRANVAPATGKHWIVINDPDVSQGVDLTDNGPLPVEAQVERPLDRLTLIAQRVLDKINRALRQPEGDIATIAFLPARAERASLFLAFDGNGDPIAAAGTSADLGPVSAFATTLLDDADAAAARATLGAVGLTGDEVIAGAKTFSGAVDVGGELNVAGATTLDDTLNVAGSTAIGGVLSVAGAITPVAGQIVFPSTQNPSVGTTVLDDYREGTWTPTVGGTATYTSRGGSYIKIGRLVHLVGIMIINTIGTGRTSLISGLPFPIESGGIHTPGSVQWNNLATNVVNVSLVGDAGFSQIQFWATAAAGTNQSVLAIFGNGTSVYFSLVYQTDN